MSKSKSGNTSERLPRVKFRSVFKRGISRPGVFRDRNHRRNYCKFSLSGDIETNPGPSVVDPRKTIVAPYSQGNIAVFGSNAGRQCVAMSLSALIFNLTNFINLTEDLIEIMDIGNNLYSVLSQSSGQAFLLLTDLPGTVRIRETGYKLQFSESYVGNLFGSCVPIEGYPYCATLAEAFDSLLTQNYTSFILTISCSTVAVFRLPDGRLKVFDSHGRDSFGMAHPQGNCVLIEIVSVANLVEYFETFYAQLHHNAFEMRGVEISLAEDERRECCFEGHIIEQRSETNICSCKQCCAISFYSICFSVIKPCIYWDSDTLVAIIENGNTFYRSLNINVDKHVSVNDLPNKLQICGADINVVFVEKRQGTLSYNMSNQVLHQFIFDNKKNNTGFLLWFSTYCLSCIFQHQTRGTTKFAVSAFDDSKRPYLFEVVDDIDSLINIICSIVSDKFAYDELQYEIQFISCFCQLTRTERQNITGKPTCKSYVKKQEILKRRRQHYALMKPAKKRILLNDKAGKYRSMDSQQKQDLLSKEAEKYRSMNPKQKQDLQSKKAKKYISMDSKQKQQLQSKKAEIYRSMDLNKKEALIHSVKQKYQDMEMSAKRQKLESKKSKYHGMHPEKKEVELVKQREANKKRKSKNILPNLDYYISVFQKKRKEGPYYICSVCNRILYRKSVVEMKRIKYNIQDIFTDKRSFDEKGYICKTCHLKVLKGKVPCQAVCNNMYLD